MSDSLHSDSAIEIINESFSRGDFRSAIFDFDGTLSLLRRNWQDVMIPMMVDVLAVVDSSAIHSELTALVEEFVMRLNGRQTIYQMIRLAEEVKLRGGQALEPLEYKEQYHQLLWKQVAKRIDSVKNGQTPPEEMTVPGTQALLDSLRQRNITLYLASGTDLKYVRDEVEVLGLGEFFGPRIYGALDDYKKFSKAMVIERIIRESGVRGAHLLGLGDGFVEIEEVKKVGGLAVGVASQEETRQGVNVWKRQRLIRAGADLIIGDYRQGEQLLSLLEIQ